MRILLDTCAFLWILLDAPELSRRAREVFVRPDNEIYLSAVSAAEIAVKHALGRQPLPAEPRVFISERRARYRIKSLPLDEVAALGLARLPDVHKDPFDRLLICQAIASGLTILTPDPAITQYAVSTLW